MKKKETHNNSKIFIRIASVVFCLLLVALIQPKFAKADSCGGNFGYSVNDKHIDVNFFGWTTNPGGVDVNIDFGDGNNFSAFDPSSSISGTASHDYSDYGDYNITLSVSPCIPYSVTHTASVPAPVVPPPASIIVNSNQATSWTINGPDTFAGSGTFGNYSTNNFGTYSISAGGVSCFGLSSASPAQNVNSGQTIVFNLDYEDDGSCAQPPPNPPNPPPPGPPPVGPPPPPPGPPPVDPPPPPPPASANLISSTKSIYKVAGKLYTSSTVIHENDTVTFQIDLRNTGSGAATINHICDKPSSNFTIGNSFTVSGGGSGSSISSASVNCSSYTKEINLTGSLASSGHWIVRFDSTFHSSGSGNLELCSNTGLIRYTDAIGPDTKVVKFGATLCNKGGGGWLDFHEIAP